MRPFIPSLQSLLAFEAAARHLSFTRAAEELVVTQTAISHQIKALEERLETKLFTRKRNTLALTPAATEYLRSVGEAISLLAIASENARKKAVSSVLVIACLPAYAVHCLLPKLPEFQRLNPDITVHVSTSSNFHEFESNAYDVAIRYGSGRWNGMRSDLLHNEEFFPVCSPRLYQAVGATDPGLSESERLSRFIRIRTYFYALYQDDWPSWLEAVGYGNVQFSGEAVFQLQLMSQAAAVEGMGLAIGRTPLVDRDLAQGKLVAPFDARVRSSSNYFLTSTVAKTKLRRVERFREWALANLGSVQS